MPARNRHPSVWESYGTGLWTVQVVHIELYIISGCTAQDTTHLIQRPCYQRGSLCQDPAGNWTTRRPPDDRKETQTAVVWSCFPFIRSDKNDLARHSQRGEEDKTNRGRGGKTTSGNGQAWSSPSPRAQWRTGKNGEN